MNVVGGGTGRRRKRSTDNGPYEFNPEQPVRRDFTWPTPSGISEDDATQVCSNAIINVPAYQKCYELFGEAIKDPVKSCVEDIKVSNIFGSNEH